MNDRPRSSLAVWLVVAIALPPAYVLSTGPIGWLCRHGYLGEWIGWLYAPIGYAIDNCEPFERVMKWYLGLWGW